MTDSAPYPTVHGTAPDVELSLLPRLRPADRKIANPYVPESRRVCGHCGGPVGRSLDGQPGRADGFCPSCGKPFSYSIKLRRGDLVARQYEVSYCLARGGLGWVYKAQDRNLGDREVALKGLVNSKDEQAAEVAVSENQFLIAIEHSNIVRIFNVVTHPDRETGELTSYTVMDYVHGWPLSALLKEDSPVRGRGLLVENVIAYGLEILKALIYLHDERLIYCDMKPANVIHGNRGVKVIDLGGVRRIGALTGTIIGTVPYQVSKAERDKHGLTVRSDVYALGVTLNQLFEKVVDSTDGEVAFAVESFRRVLERSTEDFDNRFANAREMQGQLQGVLDELLSLKDGQSRPPRSGVFAESPMLADSGLGQCPPLEQWIGRRQGRYASTRLTDGRPGPYEMVLGLPTPQEDPHDPATAALTSVHAPDAVRLLRRLESFPASVEVEFRRCRAYLELRRLKPAGERVDAAVKLLAELADYDWRISWYRGLVALAAGKNAVAQSHFQRVYEEIPGEVAPKLALALCAEQLGALARAKQLYDAVWKRDRMQASAAFGLVRITLAKGNRNQAVDILDEIPDVSRHFDAATIGAIRIRAGRLSDDDTGLPTALDLSNAVARLNASYVEGEDEHEESWERLITAVRESALDWLVAPWKRNGPVEGGAVLGEEPTENELRRLLENSYRLLGRQARSEADFGSFIDLANSVRPRTRV